MATNYTDLIIEKLFKIVEGKFKRSIKIFKTDRFDLHHNQICIIEVDSKHETTLATHREQLRINIDIILRHKYTKDENKKEFLNQDFHDLRQVLFNNRNQTAEPKWFNGIPETSDEIEIEFNENEQGKFWKKVIHWTCLLIYDPGE